MKTRYTQPEAAAYCRLPLSTWKRLRQTGAVPPPCGRVGRFPYWTAPAIQVFANSRAPRANASAWVPPGARLVVEPPTPAQVQRLDHVSLRTSLAFALVLTASQAAPANPPSEWAVFELNVWLDVLLAAVGEPVDLEAHHHDATGSQPTRLSLDVHEATPDQLLHGACVLLGQIACTLASVALLNALEGMPQALTLLNLNHLKEITAELPTQ